LSASSASSSLELDPELTSFQDFEVENSYLVAKNGLIEAVVGELE
jgi:hypothetical protein